MWTQKTVVISQEKASRILGFFPSVTTDMVDELDRHLIAQIKFNANNYIELNMSQVITIIKWLSSASIISDEAKEILLELNVA